MCLTVDYWSHAPPSLSYKTSLTHSVVMIVFFYRLESALSEFLHNSANRNSKCKLCMLHETAQLTRETISRHLISAYIVAKGLSVRCITVRA